MSFPIERVAAICVLMVCLVIASVLLWPVPAPSDRPAFPNQPVRATLAEFAGSNAPRPLGSREHECARQRIKSILQRQGYAPQEQTRWVCNPGACAAVENVFARLEGKSPRSVLVSAHYDSVAASAGVADNAAGVAVILEIARLLKGRDIPANSLVFLFTDGEEAGLLGARAFVESEAWHNVAAVVNLDARGTSGPTLMFETGRNNLDLLRLFARATRGARASSVYPLLYTLLPNRTDFSVFRESGAAGFNLAYIGGGGNHTQRDTLERVSWGAIDQLGQTALDLVRALATTDLDRRRAGDAVYYDLPPGRTKGWPSRWAWALRGGVVLLSAVGLFLQFRAGVRSAAMLAGAGLVLAAVLLGAAWGWLLARVAGPGIGWTMWLVAAASSCVVTVGLRRVAAGGGSLAGVCALWSLLAAVAPTPASYLFLLPALGVVAAACATTAAPGWPALRAALLSAATLIAILLWAPLAGLCYEAMGSSVLPLLGAAAMLVLTSAVPAIGRVRPRPLLASAAALAGAALIAGAIGFRAQRATPLPARLNLFYSAGADGQATWVATGQLPRAAPALCRAASFSGRPVQPFAWPSEFALTAPAPPAQAPPPALDILDSGWQEGGWRVRLRLKSNRSAPVVALFVPPQARVREARMNGVRMPDPPAAWTRAAGGWQWYRCLTTPAEGIQLDLTFGRGLPVQAQIADASFGLPQAAAPLLAARSRFGLAFQDGDLTVSSRAVVLAPLSSPRAKR